MLRAVIVRTLLVLLLLVVVLGVVIFFLQDRMIYGPRPYQAFELENWGREGFEQIEFRTGQGKQVAFYYPPEQGGDPRRLWLVFSGNGGRAMGYRDVIAEPDCGYYFIDYPGYGLCEGKPNPKRIDEAVDGALGELDKRLGTGAFKDRLCVIGHSLGGAVALRAAVRHEIDRVIVLAPFTTMKAMAKRTVGGLYANVLRHRFDNVEAMASLQEKNPDVRVTVINGMDDNDVPPAMGEELAERFAGIAEYVALEGVGHNDIFSEELGTVLEAMRSGGASRR